MKNQELEANKQDAPAGVVLSGLLWRIPLSLVVALLKLPLVLLAMLLSIGGETSSANKLFKICGWHSADAP